ncbi:MAG TPA: zf-HC2 domain-containing protein [Candidatus Acidoferrum sp.]
MCDYSGKLMAWLDRELSEDRMAEVQHHIGECTECRTWVAKYEQVSKTFDAYCDAMAAVKAHSGRPWVPMLSAVAAAVVAATLALVLLRPPVEQPAIRPAMVPASPANVLESMPTSGKAVHRRRAASNRQVQAAAWLPTEPAIQIAIPAESMFPPGAVPEGVNFTADVSFGPDGSAQQIRFRPRLIGFERKATQP